MCRKGEDVQENARLYSVQKNEDVQEKARLDSKSKSKREAYLHKL